MIALVWCNGDLLASVDDLRCYYETLFIGGRISDSFDGQWIKTAEERHSAFEPVEASELDANETTERHVKADLNAAASARSAT